jgi:hypothetical protein
MLAERVVLIVLNALLIPPARAPHASGRTEGYESND